MDKEVVMGFISVTDVLVSTFGLVAGAIAAHELFAISKLCSDKKKRREAEKKDSYKLLIELSQATITQRLCFESQTCQCGWKV